MQLKLDMSCHLLNVYTKFQIDISKHVEEKSGKHGRTDGRTDGRTLPRHNTSRFSNGRIKSPENSSEAETWFWWNSNLMCRWLGALLTPPFECFCPPEGQKLPKHDKSQYGSRHSLFECVYQIWGLYIIFKAMNADKWLWPTFGSKVGQSV